MASAGDDCIRHHAELRAGVARPLLNRTAIESTAGEEQTRMQGCKVCDNPRTVGLSEAQIQWHNHGHPGLEELKQQFDNPRRLRAVVVIRPGDQILYELKPGKLCRVDELDVALAAGHGVNEVAARCLRCKRRVLERRPSACGFWRSLIETVALRALKKAA